MTKPYVVFVDDNFHFMNEDERTTSGEFDTLAEAILNCQTIIDEFLESALQPGMSAAELLDQYYSFGDDRFIRGADADFSAGNYAKKRCAELCTAGDPHE